MTSPRQLSRFRAGPEQEPGVLTPEALVPCSPGGLRSKKVSCLRSCWAATVQSMMKHHGEGPQSSSQESKDRCVLVALKSEEVRMWGGGIWKREVGTISLLPSLPLFLPSSSLIESLPIFHWPKTRSSETGIAICNEKKKTSTLTGCSLANQRQRGPTQKPQKSTGIATLPTHGPPPSLFPAFGGDVQSSFSSLLPQPPAQSNPSQGQRGAGSGSGVLTLSSTPGPKGWESCLG